mmetsp:Transcript_2417/g.5143  ORF Transcript_2417/g.5143 Transcript_2417/m.5143 type:complete len:610 (+) Transcript_2417:732-2561(+)
MQKNVESHLLFPSFNVFQFFAFYRFHKNSTIVISSFLVDKIANLTHFRYIFLSNCILVRISLLFRVFWCNSQTVYQYQLHPDDHRPEPSWKTSNIAMTNLPASTLFLFSTLVAMFSNQGIFANGQTLADKWAIEEPTVTFDSSTNTFTMSHVVDPSIVQANTAASIYEQDCLEGGNELIVADGIEATTTAVDTPGVATLTFDLNPGILSQNSDIFTNFPEERTAQMKICSRFKLQTNDASIEVNYLESIITVTFDLTAGFVLDAFSVESKERDDGTRDKAYEVEAYLCDPNVPSVSIDGTTFNQGSVISVCVTPTVEALNDGLFLERINEFNWVRGFIEQPAIQNNIQAANSLTQFECEPGAIYCTFSSVLYADFYKAPTLAPSSGPTYIGETQVPTSEATTEATAQSTTGGTICEGMNTTVEMDLDFSQSIVKQSDLQNGGELRFGNIGAIEGQAIDLLVTSSDYSNPNAENPAGKDPSGTFGEIAVKTLQGQPTSGRANFEFCLVQEDTDMPVTAASFQWYVNARACVCVCVCVCERASDCGTCISCTDGTCFRRRFVSSEGFHGSGIRVASQQKTHRFSLRVVLFSATGPSLTSTTATAPLVSTRR